MKSLVAAVALSLSIGIGAAFAQTPPPAPVAQSAAPAKMDDKMNMGDKKAVSKSCSDQANAKSLHGKARKKFRSECKHNGGKAM
jgi:hypothetical protein